MMTSRERVEAVLKHRIPDRVPTNISRPKMTPDEEAYFNKKYGSDFLQTHDWDLREIVPPIAFPTGPIRMVDDIPWYMSPIISDDYHELDELQFPDPDDPAIYEPAKAFLKANPGKALAFDIICPFTILHGMRLMDNMYLDVYDNPEGLHRAVDKIWSVSRRVLENVLKMGLDISAVYLLDDIASQHSLLFSPKTLDEFLFPCVQEGVQLAKSKNLPVLYHSDGNLTQILPRLVELGIDAVNPMQVECNDMAEFKRLYHGKLTCFGGVDNTGVLLHGTPDDVRRHIRELFETVGKDGGLIFASHMMDKATPRENFLAMYEAMMTCEY